ncbi:MAG: paraquat-inducible protein A [Psittacicella sp.]
MDRCKKIDPFSLECKLCGSISRLEISYNDKCSSISCPTCGVTLARKTSNIIQKQLAYAIAGIIILILSISFNFLSLNFGIFDSSIHLLKAFWVIKSFHHSIIAFIFILSVLILPFTYFSLQVFIYLYIYIKDKKDKLNKEMSVNLDIFARRLAKIFFRVKEWMMLDVFLVGSLVSISKLIFITSVKIGPSYIAFFILTLISVKSISGVDTLWVWEHLKKSTYILTEEINILPKEYCSCELCYFINKREDLFCKRCNSKLRLNYKLEAQKSSAFLLLAVICYIPINFFPMMNIIHFGSLEESTILQGIYLLWEDHSYVIALVIFVVSFSVPIFKILAMFLLLISLKSKSITYSRLRFYTKLYIFVKALGKWSMIDVFAVVLLTSLVQFNEVMSIYPGAAALYFALVVVATILSEQFFNPKFLWDKFYNK